jgi:tetratricopeptide (TPR) repeat protein
LVALAIFVLALFPILGFLPAIYMKNHSYVADHWQYVALVAPVALAVSAAARWLQGEWVRKGAAVVVLAVLAALTFQHAIIHRSQKALWTHNLTVTDSWDAHLGLCRQLMLEGKIPEAIAEAKLAIGRFGGATLAWVHLADLLVKEDRFAEAVVAYRVAIDQDAGDEFYSRAGIAAAKSGDLAAAVEFFAEGAKRLPDDVSLRIDWGRALHELGRRDESIDRYREALAIDGEMPAALNGLAYCLASRPRAARQPIEPEDAAEAVELAKRACTLTDDKDAAYLDTLATAYAAGGDFEAAVATAERALALAEETDDKELLNEVRGHLDRFRVRLPIAEP